MTPRPPDRGRSGPHRKPAGADVTVEARDWRAACRSAATGTARPDPAKTAIGGATAKRKASAGIGGSDAAGRRRTGDRWRSRKAGPRWASE